MFEKLSCEDVPAAALYEAYIEAHKVEAKTGNCANCGAPSTDPFCSDFCRDEAGGYVDWNVNEGALPEKWVLSPTCRSARPHGGFLGQPDRRRHHEPFI